jgi:ATP-dependent DNA helicase RecG
MNVLSPEDSVERFLSADIQLHAFVPSLLASEPLTGILRPRNFAVLLFGRETQRFIPGATSLFSKYPGLDRTEPRAERHELADNLIQQSSRLVSLLENQSHVVYNRLDTKSPNAISYPQRALYEVISNALAHRDYENTNSIRVTVFADRIEIISPGSLPPGTDFEKFREGKASPNWRNQTLCWFFNKLQLAQREGQGISTILRTMREGGCPPPQLEADSHRVLCILPAHPWSRPLLVAKTKDAARRPAVLRISFGTPAITELVETSLPLLGLESAILTPPFVRDAYLEPHTPAWEEAISVGLAFFERPIRGVNP